MRQKRKGSVISPGKVAELPMCNWVTEIKRKLRVRHELLSTTCSWGLEEES